MDKIESWLVEQTTLRTRRWISVRWDSRSIARVMKARQEERGGMCDREKWACVKVSRCVGSGNCVWEAKVESVTQESGEHTGGGHRQVVGVVEGRDCARCRKAVGCWGKEGKDYRKAVRPVFSSGQQRESRETRRCWTAEIRVEHE